MDSLFFFLHKAMSKVRSKVFSFVYNAPISSVGRGSKIIGRKAIGINGEIRLGDNCLIQAITEYRGQSFEPQLQIGSHLMLSDRVRISCAYKITIERDTLIGSNVYIGDHSHGTLNVDKLDIAIPPYMRALDDFKEVFIGERVWIGNGVVVLAGAHICAGSIVAANAVVKDQYYRPCVIGGVPAKVIKYLN
ncbi:hypothetical protein JYB87_13120 [Shewanella avicenniae]|uniref:Acetyltransferase (Isoleucine patch superfamily) n=1 Tax=Shewanella avicenniae TaxID=2814294 RepID=A0ABX7QMM6_9GAMM|nr:DapH/DapD/GlmU-related protein [Shewanella avicenniae]QSX32686.1 hypothetical protein JYB87_13120 [Shewanella avicenniae]